MSQGFSIVDQGKGPHSPAPSPGPHPRSDGEISYCWKISSVLVHTTGAGQIGFHVHSLQILGGHQKPAIGGHLKSGQRDSGTRH